MRKKFFVFAAAAAVACLGLAGCSFGRDTSFQDGARYTSLNDMVGADYSEIVLTITNTFGGDSLTSVYDMKYGAEITVAYSVEKLVRFDPDALSADWKTTQTGTATILGDRVVLAEGEDIGLSAEIAELPFEFKEAYFANEESGGNFFAADVEDIAGFLGLGAPLVCTHMTVRAEFGTTLISLTIGFTASRGNQVNVFYTFIK